jgi:G3E family GTPase
VLVPVVLLTGFLGSGKTTLLNRILAHRQAQPAAPVGKLAVLVNELGSVGIDGSLLPPGAARQIELPGGCICCTLDENLAESLIGLLDAEPAVEWVVVETTGIAEPLPIIWTLTGDEVGRRARLTAVVTVVDALEHERHRPVSPSVDVQVEHADILVVSKHDALPRDEADPAIARLAADLRRHNPTAALLIEADPAASAAALWRLLSDSHADSALERSVPPHSRDTDTTHAHTEGQTAPHGFDTVALPIEGTLDFEELTSQLEALPSEYVRIKGICWAVDLETGSDEPRLIAFHRVGARVSAEPLAAQETHDPTPRFVALGPGIERDRLAACLRAAMVRCES